MSRPLIQLDPEGTPSILSYSMAEPQSHSGDHIVELQLEPAIFDPAASQVPEDEPPGGPMPTQPRPEVGDLEVDGREGRLRDSLVRGVDDRVMDPGDESPADGNPRNTMEMRRAGFRPNRYLSMFGTVAHNYVPATPKVRPRLLLVERYRLSSFLGRYGAGRTLRTLTLMPGEKTRISVQTYSKTKTSARQASSILDSFTQQSADEFEQQVQAEQTDKRNYQETFEFNANAEAEASWGFGKAKVSTGVKHGTTAAREQFAKNLSNAVRKHSARASAKREVKVDTTYEVDVESGEQLSIEREIANINAGRTLNYVFRQMNQEFITLLHLTDLHVAFFNGHRSSRRVVPLSRLDELLDEVLVDDETVRAEVRQQILEQIEVVFDHRDEPQSFTETRVLAEGDGYVRVRPDLTSTYDDPISGTKIEVPGIILAASSTVMRTEAVVVEALMGEGVALDEYALRLQQTEIERRQADKDLLVAQADFAALRNDIVRDGDAARAQLLQLVMPRPTNDASADESDD